MRLVFLLLIFCVSSYAQEKRYFSHDFQKMAEEETAHKRIYFFEDNKVLTEDVSEGETVLEAMITGLDGINKVDEFSFYAITQGNEIFYRDYFKKAKGTFNFFEKGKICKQLILQDNKVKFSQVWNPEGGRVLNNGTGDLNYYSAEMEESVYEKYSDSVLVVKYGIRSQNKDTIYYSYDKMARPKDGYEKFYSDLIKMLKYPGIARLVGKEGRIHV